MDENVSEVTAILKLLKSRNLTAKVAHQSDQQAMPVFTG
jgi:hypothetical protein